MEENNNNNDIFDYIANNSKPTSSVQVTEQDVNKIQEIKTDEEKLQEFLESVANSYNYLDENREFKLSSNQPPQPQPEEKPVEMVLPHNPQEENLQPLVSRFDKTPTSQPASRQQTPQLQQPVPNYSSEFENVDLTPISSRLDSNKITPTAPHNDDTLPSKVDVKSKFDDSSTTISDVDDDFSDIVCPVDEDMDESGKMSYFFNLGNTLRFYNFNWLASKLDVDNSKFEKPFFQRLANKLHAKYEEKKTQSRAQRDAARKKQKGILILIPSGILFLIIAIVLFTSIPNMKLKSGIKSLRNGDYVKAQKTLCSKMTKNPPYCVLAQSYVAAYSGEYDTAYEGIEALLPYQSLISEDLGYTQREFKFNQAKELIATDETSNIENGLKILQEISNHAGVAEYFGETCYALAEKYLSLKDNAKAIEYFYMAGEYSDSKEKFQTVASEFYTEALQFYNNKDYSKAQIMFKQLAQYNYENSVTLYSQCIYTSALDKYKSGNYSESNKLFKSIKYFKDSSVLIKE